MMGELPKDQGTLFYDFCLEDHVPKDHLRPFESLAIPLIQKHFCETMVFRQSVATTG